MKIEKIELRDGYVYWPGFITPPLWKAHETGVTRIIIRTSGNLWWKKERKVKQFLMTFGYDNKWFDEDKIYWA